MNKKLQNELTNKLSDPFIKIHLPFYTKQSFAGNNLARKILMGGRFSREDYNSEEQSKANSLLNKIIRDIENIAQPYGYLMADYDTNKDDLYAQKMKGKIIDKIEKNIIGEKLGDVTTGFGKQCRDCFNGKLVFVKTENVPKEDEVVWQDDLQQSLYCAIYPDLDHAKEEGSVEAYLVKFAELHYTYEGESGENFKGLEVVQAPEYLEKRFKRQSNEDIKEELSSKIGNVSSTAKKVGSDIKKGAQAVGDKTKEVGKTIADGAKKTGEKVKEGVNNAGKGVKKGAKTVSDKTKEIADKVKNKIGKED